MIISSLIIFVSTYFDLISLSVDSNVFIDLTNHYLSNSINKLAILFDKNFHVFFLTLLKVNDLDFNYYYIINIFFLTLSLLQVFNITDILIDKNKSNQIFIAKISIIVFSCFLPSMYFFYTQLGKELIVLFAIIFILKFLIFENSVKSKLSIILNYFILFFSSFILFISKDYLILSLLVFFFVISISNFFFKKDIILLKKISIIIFFILIISLLKYIISKSIALPLFEYYQIVIDNSGNPVDIFKNFNHNNKNFFDKIFLPFNKIRFFLIHHSLINDATSLLSIYTPHNYSETIKLFFISLLQSLFFPSSYFGNNVSFLYRIASLENFVYLLILSSIFFNKKNVYQKLLLLYFVLISGLLLYLNPNIGSFYKQKACFMYVLSIFGIIYWIQIIENIYFNFSNSISLSKFNNKISKISSDSFKISLLVIIASILIIFRDYLIIINSIDIILLDYYFLLIVFLSVVATSINVPLNESINFTIVKGNKFNYYSLIKLILINFFISTLILVFFYNQYNISKILIITLLLIFFISILINSFFVNYFIFNNQHNFIYLSQILGTITSILYLSSNFDTINEFIILNSLSIWIFSTIIFNALFSKNIIKFYRNNFTFNNHFIDNDLYHKFFLNILTNLSLILLIFILFSDKNYFSINYSIRFYLYFFTFIIIIFNFVITPFLNKYYQDKKNENFIFLFLNFLIPLSILFVLFVIISVEFIFIYLLNDTAIFSASLINNTKFLFLGVPIHFCNYFLTKMLIVNEEYKKSFNIYFYTNILFSLLILLSYFIDMSIVIIYLGVLISQFILLNFTIRKKFDFIIEKINILLIITLYLIFFLNLNKFIIDQSFLYLLFLVILCIKLRFYDKKKFNIFSN